MPDSALVITTTSQSSSSPDSSSESRTRENNAEPIVGAVAADWEIRYPKGVRRDKGDASNSQPTTKALLDGLVPRWLEDDGPQHVVAETFRRGPNLTVPRIHEVRLTLTPQETR